MRGPAITEIDPETKGDMGVLDEGKTVTRVARDLDALGGPLAAQ